MVDGDVIAFLQIGDAVGEGADRQGVGADEHLAVAVADHQGRPRRAPIDLVALALDQHRQGIGAAEPVERRLEGVDRGQARRSGTGRSGGRSPRCRSRSRRRGPWPISSACSSAKFSMMPLWTSGDAAGAVGVGVALRWARRGSPSGCGRCRRWPPAASRRARPPGRGSCPWPRRRSTLAVDQRRDAGRVVAAVFQALEALDQTIRDRPVADDADDAAHEASFRRLIS